jgi:hypothetical protein
MDCFCNIPDRTRHGSRVAWSLTENCRRPMAPPRVNYGRMARLAYIRQSMYSSYRQPVIHEDPPPRGFMCFPCRRGAMQVCPLLHCRRYEDRGCATSRRECVRCPSPPEATGENGLTFIARHECGNLLLPASARFWKSALLPGCKVELPAMRHWGQMHIFFWCAAGRYKLSQGLGYARNQEKTRKSTHGNQD